MNQVGLYRTTQSIEIESNQGITVEPIESSGPITKYSYSFELTGLLVGPREYSGTFFHADFEESDIIGIALEDGKSYQEVADRISKRLMQMALTAEEFWEILGDADSFNREQLRIQHPAFGMSRVRSIVKDRGEVTNQSIDLTVEQAREEQYEVITATNISFPNVSQKVTFDQYSSPLEVSSAQEIDLQTFEEVVTLLSDVISNRSGSLVEP